jgi:hypothetical protein
VHLARLRNLSCLWGGAGRSSHPGSSRTIEVWACWTKMQKPDVGADLDSTSTSRKRKEPFVCHCGKNLDADNVVNINRHTSKCPSWLQEENRRKNRGRGTGRLKRRSKRPTTSTSSASRPRLQWSRKRLHFHPLRLARARRYQRLHSCHRHQVRVSCGNVGVSVDGLHCRYSAGAHAHPHQRLPARSWLLAW